MIDMCKWLDIGHPYKQYSSPEVARKMNFITKIKFGSDTKMKKIIMERCSFKSSSKKEKHNDKRLCCNINNAKEWLFGMLIIYHFRYNLLTLLSFSRENLLLKG